MREARSDEDGAGWSFSLAVGQPWWVRRQDVSEMPSEASRVEGRWESRAGEGDSTEGQENEDEDAEQQQTAERRARPIELETD